MTKIHYKSDFDFILRFLDAEGNDIGWPDFDWKAKIWTLSPTNSLTASSVAGELTNCFNDNGRVHVVCNSHSLGCGRLQAEVVSEIPDSIYPDDSRKVVTTAPFNIDLVRSMSADEIATEAESIPVAVIKGEKGDPGAPGRDADIAGCEAAIASAGKAALAARDAAAALHQRWYGTEAEYAALESKDDNTDYFITE